MDRNERCRRLLAGVALAIAMAPMAAAVDQRPVKFGTSLPVTCWAGDIYFKTDAAAGSNLYACVAPNTWVVQAGTGSGGGGGTSVGFSETRTSNTVTSTSLTATPVNVKFGSVVASFSNGGTVTLGTSSCPAGGLIWKSVTPAGQLQIDANAIVALANVLVSGFVKGSNAASGVPSGNFPLFRLSCGNNAVDQWDTNAVQDLRATYAQKNVGGGTFVIPTEGPTGTTSLDIDPTKIQGTDAALLTAGTIASGPAHLLCTDGNGGATTSGCPSGGSGGSGQGYTWRGAWSSSTAYVAYDTVSYNGSSYIAIASTTNVAPDSDQSKWNLMAQVGATGPQGPSGSGGGGQGYTWRGAWSLGTTYAAYDTVSYNGSSYVAVASSTNVTPGSDQTKWNLMAQVGAQGPTGGGGGGSMVISQVFALAHDANTPGDGVRWVNIDSIDSSAYSTDGPFRVAGFKTNWSSYLVLQTVFPRSSVSSIDLNLHVIAGVGTKIYTVSTACLTYGSSTAASNPTYNTSQSATASSSFLTFSEVAITPLTMTGCAAGKYLYVKIANTGGTDTSYEAMAIDAELVFHP